MHIETSGTAVIRHKDTGQVFEIEAEEIAETWDSVGADEEQMGTRTTWEAAIEHPDLGTLTWQLWEYPDGAFNGTDTDVDGHVLLSDFQIGLEHDGDDADDSEDDEAAIETMIAWFHENYEDPANRVPYESAEGGYQWIYGGPETPIAALGDNFGSEYRHELIERAATHITDKSGLFERSPIPGAGWADDDGTDDESQQERRARLASEIVDDAALIQRTLRPLLEFEAATQRGATSGLAGIGHNNPPSPLEELGFPANFFAELSQLTQTVADNVSILNAAAAKNGGTEDALYKVAAAHHENTEAVRKNTEAMIEATKQVGWMAGGLWAGDKVFGEVLAQLGAELADWGIPLLKVGAVGAGGFMQKTAHLLGTYVDKVTEFLAMFM